MAERPEDLNLPSAVVCRIVKDALPPNTKVTKEAQAAIAKVKCLNKSGPQNNATPDHYSRTMPPSPPTKHYY